MITIRQCRPDDWEIVKLIRLSALEDAPHAFSETLEHARQVLDSGWKDIAIRNSKGEESTYALAFNDEEPIGMAGGFISQTDRKRAYVSTLWVDPRFRGAAVAKGLIRFIINWASDMGAGLLTATVTLENLTAQGFYKKSDFELSELSGPEKFDQGKLEIPIKKSFQTRDMGCCFKQADISPDKIRLVEKRNNPREKCHMAVNLAFEDKSLAENILNISNGGMFVSCTEPVSVGIELKVVFHAPERGLIERIGKVNWGNQDGLGIQFP